MADGSGGNGTGTIGSYTAVGDSFTEGVGDPGPDGAFVGWADRLARMLAERHAAAEQQVGAEQHGGAERHAGDEQRTAPEERAAAAPPGGFRYANLAVRGRLLDQVVAEQVPRAVEFGSDLVTFAAGGNDMLRPGSDPDAVAERYEAAIARLTATAGTVMVYTGFDTRGVPVLGLLRGKIATFNAHIRAVADRYGCPVVDLWSLRSVHDRRAWSQDRLHLSTQGHIRVALRAAQVLGLPAPADPDEPWPPLSEPAPSQVRRENIQWAREYLVPWIGRRLRGVSSGDDVRPKRPDLLPLG